VRVILAPLAYDKSMQDSSEEKRKEREGEGERGGERGRERKCGGGRKEKRRGQAEGQAKKKGIRGERQPLRVHSCESIRTASGIFLRRLYCNPNSVRPVSCPVDTGKSCGNC
jgi:hypothetical protein